MQPIFFLDYLVLEKNFGENFGLGGNLFLY